MTVNAVSEVDAPGQSGRDSISMIGKAIEKASNSSDRYSHRDWNREKISGPASDLGSTLDPLHCEGATQQSSDDGLTGEEVGRFEHVPQRGYGVFKPVKNPAAQRRPHGGGSDHTEAIRGRKKIPLQAATSTIHIEADGVSDRLED